MPWDGKTFAARHNKRLRGEAADKAAAQATAMVRRGVPEGIAIATANKTGDRAMAKKPKFWAPKADDKTDEKGKPAKDAVNKRRLRDAYDKKKD